MKNRNKKSEFFISRILIFKTIAFAHIFCLLWGGIFLWPKAVFSADLSPEKIIALTNEARTRSGANALNANQLLAKAAYEKAHAILDEQSFQHTINGRRFSEWIRETSYSYSYAGENLAMDFKTSAGAVKAWHESPTHQKNLLNPAFSEIGVAVVPGIFAGRETVVVVQIFGSPRLAETAPLASSIVRMEKSELPKSTANGFNSDNINKYNVPVGQSGVLSVEKNYFQTPMPLSSLPVIERRNPSPIFFTRAQPEVIAVLFYLICLVFLAGIIIIYAQKRRMSDGRGIFIPLKAGKEAR